MINTLNEDRVMLPTQGLEKWQHTKSAEISTGVSCHTEKCLKTFKMGLQIPEVNFHTIDHFEILLTSMNS